MLATPAGAAQRVRIVRASYAGLMQGPDGDVRGEYDEDDHDDDTEPYWFPGQHLPEDARRMGLSQHVPEGALIDFAGSLNGAKTWHRVAAWLLLAVFGLPVFFTILRIWHAFA